MGARGPKPGTPRVGGRQKGKTNQDRQLFLAKIEEQFRDKHYDPIAEMIKLAQKPTLDAQDMMYLDIHKTLAKKHFPDVAALKVSGDPEAPLTFVIERTSYVDYIAEQVVSNGKGSTHTPTV